MEEIKKLLEEEKKIENVRKSLVALLGASLDVLEKVARDHDPGKELCGTNQNYLDIFRISKGYLPEEELEKINDRYIKIRDTWAKKKK